MRKISIARPRLADLVYKQILEALGDGSLAQTERLHQERIAVQLEVSRTPVREALLRLEHEGVLVAANGGGFEPRKIKPEDVRMIYEARIAIEGYSAGFLAATADAEVLSDLLNEVLTLEQTTPDSISNVYEANRRIHRAFVEKTDNSDLLRMLDDLWNRSLSFHIFGTMNQHHLEQSLTGHEALCTALEQADFHSAFDAMRSHISQGLELQLSAL